MSNFVRYAFMLAACLIVAGVAFFVFQNDGYHTFWMKDMLFSIDIIWLSHEGTVVDIAKDVSPDTFPMSFSPRAFARYVLELPARFVEEYTIQIGDEVRF